MCELLVWNTHLETETYTPKHYNYNCKLRETPSKLFHPSSRACQMSFMSMTSALLSWGLWGLTASFWNRILHGSWSLICWLWPDFSKSVAVLHRIFTGSSSQMPVICALLLGSAVKLFNPISTLQKLPWRQLHLSQQSVLGTTSGSCPGGHSLDLQDLHLLDFQAIP